MRKKRNNKYVFGLFFGGRPFDDIAVGEWDSAEDFLRSSYNSKGDKDDRENTNYYRFEHGYEIKTTPEQDKLISEKFKEISENESYFFFGNNCATTVARSLIEGGIDYQLSSKYSIKLDTGFKLIDKSSEILNSYIKKLVYITPSLFYDNLSEIVVGRTVER